MFALYRKGFSHVVRGVQCELIRVEERELDQYRADGWVDDEKLLIQEEAKKEKLSTAKK